MLERGSFVVIGVHSDNLPNQAGDEVDEAENTLYSPPPVLHLLL